jgi:predicted amidophosphoribosyltransferase
MVPLADIDVGGGVDRGLAAVQYDDLVAGLIAQLKYRGQRSCATWFGSAMAGLVTAAGERPDIVSWVPALGRNQRRRGFDQGRLLACATASGLGITATHLFTRRGQRGQTGADRQHRLAGPNVAPARRPSIIDGACVLIVDDVLTTGASVRACARVARDSGARRVVAVTASHRR